MTKRAKRAFRHFVRMSRGAAVMLLLPATNAGAQAKQDPTLVARTQHGRVLGEGEGDLRVYRGIPFAAPPIGELRWRPPASPKSWRGVRETKTFAPACMQTPNPAMNLPTQPVSEDCLYLNVWTPAKSAGEALPVLVWIHGGGFAFGSTAMPLFDGAALAGKGVVFVSAAYRLGPFGYLAHPALTAESPHRSSGNYAALDQIAALRWVRDNIRAFGGDPARVTIMGESAGAVSVSALIQSPLAKGLFAGAIAQSGGNFSPEWGATTTLREAEGEGARLADRLGAPTLRALRALPAETILEATPRGAHAFTLAGSLPIIDGYVVPDKAAALYRTRRFNDVPVLIGYNGAEGALFAPVTGIAEFEAQVRARHGMDAGRVLAAYPAPSDVAAFMGDFAFGLSQFIWARWQARYGKAPVFSYHFAHDPPPRPGVKAGPVHGAELPYVFDNLKVRPLAWSDDDRRLADEMSRYWTNFAKSGDPNGAGLTRWPSYSRERPATLHFGEGPARVGEVPSVERMCLLAGLILDEDCRQER